MKILQIIPNDTKAVIHVSVKDEDQLLASKANIHLQEIPIIAWGLISEEHNKTTVQPLVICEKELVPVSTILKNYAIYTYV
jgi:hypothetical protein